MHTLITQTRTALEAKLYYLALMSSLAIPDIASALSSIDGRATKQRYIELYDSWVRPSLIETRSRENPLTGDVCYSFRCRMLHQGSSKEMGPYHTIMFIEPGYQNYKIHYCLVGGEALLIQIDEFVDEVLEGCEKWLAANEGTTEFQANYKRFARRHPDGLEPYVIGVPVIG